MEKTFKMAWLLLISVIMVGLGIALSTYSFQNFLGGRACIYEGATYRNSEEIEGYKSGNTCTCTGGEILCTPDFEVDTGLNEGDFGLKNLVFKTTFVGDTVGVELSSAALRTIFEKVSSSGGSLRVNLNQAQRCTADGKPPAQIGKYHYSNSILTLFSSVNDVADVYTDACTVDVYFQITGITVDNDLILRYQNERGERINADVCVYQNSVYNEGDAYKAEDGCNVCECSNGVNKCSNDRECTEEISTQSVYWNFPDYEKYESPESAGECSSNDDCYVRGCSKEVCSADSTVKSSCEAIKTIENLSCGCRDSKCVWAK
jgi:hypothetical protein